MEDCLRIRQEILGHDDLATAKALNNLGMALCKAGQTTRAILTLQQALKIRSRHLESCHSLIATSLKDLGSAYLDNREWENARIALEDCLQMRRTIFGDRHAATASVYDKLGEVYERQELYHEALEMVKSSLQCRRTRMIEATNANPNTSNASMKTSEEQAADTELDEREYPYAVSTYKDIQYAQSSRLEQEKEIDFRRDALRAAEGKLSSSNVPKTA